MSAPPPYRRPEGGSHRFFYSTEAEDDQSWCPGCGQRIKRGEAIARFTAGGVVPYRPRGCNIGWHAPCIDQDPRLDWYTYEGGGWYVPPFPRIT